MIKLEFLDVLCEVMVAGEDKKELLLIRGLDSENYENDCTVQELSSDELMDMLLEREDEFVSCKSSGTRLNVVMINEKLIIDIF